MDTQKPFKTIATAIAASPNMAANIAESCRIKEMIGNELLLIHIGEESEELQNEIMQAVPDGMDNISIIWEAGDPVDAILRVSKEKDVDLLIAGALPREGLIKYYMGSIARRLVRKSNCSILLLTHPSQRKTTCGKIVVDGLDHPKTPFTIDMAIKVGNRIGSTELIIVEEIPPSRETVRSEDREAIMQAENARRERRKKEEERIDNILKQSTVPENMKISKSCIFGKRGYSIGHFTQQTCADLLVMNSPDTKLGFLDRVFTHDLEYILSELPSDLLIVHSTKRN